MFHVQEITTVGRFLRKNMLLQIGIYIYIYIYTQCVWIPLRDGCAEYLGGDLGGKVTSQEVLDP